MKLPELTGIIRRRILVNYRVSPDMVNGMLPARFRPKLHRGHAIAGICLIRLEQIRPKGLPAFAGISSENCAHRIAVEWQDDSGVTREGVFVPRRDTNSLLNTVAGGRIFPGVHHHSEFTVADQMGQISIRVESDDFAAPLVDIILEESERFPSDSVFGSLEESSQYFEAGCIGYSPCGNTDRLDGLLLKVPAWKVSPLATMQVRSAFYDDPARFPPDKIQFDHALLMRDIPHSWHSEPGMSSLPPSTPAATLNGESLRASP